jgi:hypothetical protein
MIVLMLWTVPPRARECHECGRCVTPPAISGLTNDDVMVAHIGVRAAFLRADEMLEFHPVAHEEHWRVVPDHVVVALMV